MRYRAIDPSLFAANRRRLQERLSGGESVVLRAAKPQSGLIDESYVYRQDSNFFWACGIDQTDSLLVLTHNTETLYIRLANEFEQTWLDERLSLEQASAISGVGSVLPMGRYRKPAGLIDPQPLLAQLRMVKQDAELDLIKQAIAITATGITDLTQALHPGLIEYELEAEFTRQLIRQGASNAWPPVVASGPNTCVIHYGNNNRRINDGDLVLLDVGAEYAHYDADVSRTYPAGGRFSPRQKEVYLAVLDIQRRAMRLLKPGTKLQEYEREVGEMMFEALQQLGVATRADSERDNRGWPKWRKYFPHRATHHLGLDPHDLADYDQSLGAGAVLTVEPGIYIPQEGIGVRIEDDVLITKDGAVNLSADIPSAADAIEAIVAGKTPPA